MTEQDIPLFHIGTGRWITLKVLRQTDNIPGTEQNHIFTWGFIGKRMDQIFGFIIGNESPSWTAADGIISAGILNGGVTATSITYTVSRQLGPASGLGVITDIWIIGVCAF